MLKSTHRLKWPLGSIGEILIIGVIIAHPSLIAEGAERWPASAHSRPKIYYNVERRVTI